MREKVKKTRNSWWKGRFMYLCFLCVSGIHKRWKEKAKCFHMFRGQSHSRKRTHKTFPLEVKCKQVNDENVETRNLEKHDERKSAFVSCCSLLRAIKGKLELFQLWDRVEVIISNFNFISSLHAVKMNKKNLGCCRWNVTDDTESTTEGLKLL